jgi:uncharacterized protein (TIGR04255 family)
LPEFRHPPVAEVALGVYFDALPAMRAAHLGLIWDAVRDLFPKLEEHAPIDVKIEQFGPRKRQTFELQLLDAPPVPRAWMLSDDGQALLQVQQDAFVHNWRRVDPVDPEKQYPRYERLRDSFAENFPRFVEVVDQYDLGTISPVQAEVTYVNRVRIEDPIQGISDLGHLLRGWGDPGLSYPTAEIEDCRMAQQYVIHGNDGPVARLYVTVEPTLDEKSEVEELLMRLVVRGQPKGQTLDNILDFFDFGRTVVVQSFADLTTDAMHLAWERLQ